MLPKVLKTKITPPLRSSRILPRLRVTQTLREALQYRLTLLQAEAGYGKSTALAGLAEEFQPVIWYQVTDEDSDPLVFLLHLCHATRQVISGLEDLPISFLEAWDGTRGPLPVPGIVDQYLNALSEGLDHPTLLVVDDAHLVLSTSEVTLLLDRLIGLAPPPLHVLLSGRPLLSLPNLTRWRTQGEVLLLDQSSLAFNASEISSLFANQYGYELTTDEVVALLESTEGWAIALQLIWQHLRSGSSTSVDEALSYPASSLEGLFDILAREVFKNQPEDIQSFLQISSILREMNAEVCDSLRSLDSQPVHDSAAMLAYLRRTELFVVEQGDSNLRYHHIFHDFLRQMLSAERRSALHAYAAQIFQERQDFDSAIYHFLQAEDHESAAVMLNTYGMALLANGRLEALGAYLEAIPPQTLHSHPSLLSYWGDLARLRSRFQEALGWYQQAEAIFRERGLREGLGRALRGQARIYLDTVNPSKAEQLLQKAIRVSDGMEDREMQARLYELLAENRLNAGRLEEAEQFQKQAEALRSEGPSDSQLAFRVLLRTGQMDETTRRLEEQAETERLNPVQTPRAHRETQLLLSLVYAFQGRAEEAYQAALEGTQRGVDLNSPFITAVGHMRQGHALLLRSFNWALQAGSAVNSHLQQPLKGDYQQAREQFEKTIEISRVIAVPRLRVEACWGLCRWYGYQGDLAQANQAAQEAIDIAKQAGDEWIASLVCLAMGSSLTLVKRFEAAETWLNRAYLSFQECSDSFGQAVSHLWMCLGWFGLAKQHRPANPLGKEYLDRLKHNLPELLSDCQKKRYDFLFIRPTLSGPPDERLLVPLLIFARDRGWQAEYVSRLLQALGLPEISLHPGFQLRLRTMGTFQAWLGSHSLSPGAWRREKARQLFQLLVTFRHAPLDRDQIIEYLWAEVGPATAQRNFKVALNTLYNVLEPGREPGSESAYITREGSSYLLRPGADLWLDAEEFVNLVRRADSQPEQALSLLEKAINLYQGEYLPDARYETWAAAEREYLSVLFLHSADRLSELCLQSGRFEETIELCQRILAQDNCWERAYRLQMLTYDRLGDHGQVARTYQRCVQALHDELNVPPSADTDNLFRSLIS